MVALDRQLLVVSKLGCLPPVAFSVISLLCYRKPRSIFLFDPEFSTSFLLPSFSIRPPASFSGCV